MLHFPKLIIKNHTHVKKVGYTSELLKWVNKKCKNFNNVVFFLRNKKRLEISFYDCVPKILI